MVLVGVQPVLMQVPPRCASSISATLQPRSARLCERGLPPWPEPMIIASYFIVETPFSPTARGFTRERYHNVFQVAPRDEAMLVALDGCVWFLPNGGPGGANNETNRRSGIIALAVILFYWRPAQSYLAGLTGANHQG